MKKIGLIINPLAGIGGSAALKGSDGEHIVKEALRRGAVPRAELRSLEAVKKLLPYSSSFKLITGQAGMGENVAEEAGFYPEIIPIKDPGKTSAEDTAYVAEQMLEAGVDLLLFAGGDGTACDICTVLKDQICVLGIPAGVKIHSAVFAVSPAAAGEIAVSFIKGDVRKERLAEVVDIDEEEYRQERLNSKLKGYMRIPDAFRQLQGVKAGSSRSEAVVQDGMAEYLVKRMEDDNAYLICAGTTCRPVKQRLGFSGSLLGVDAWERGQLIGEDLTEKDILELGRNREFHLIISPVGGQGFILGRGNQQISPEVLKRIDKKNITILATSEKLCQLRGAPLLLDTGDTETNRLFSGYYRIITAYGEESVYKVSPAV